MSRIAMLIDQMFEDSEFRVPYDRLRAAGYDVELVGLEVGTVVEGKHKNEKVVIEKSVADVSPHRYVALVIPGGYSPDHLRADPDAVKLTRDMVHAHKTVAAVCHAPWMLVEADVVGGRIVTSWFSIRTDLINAGAHWIDFDVVVDGNVITARKPSDLQAFCDAILHQLAEGVPEPAEPTYPATMGEQSPPLH
jgi:protease I